MGEKCLESTAISRTDICEMSEEGPRELYVKVTGALEREQNDGERYRHLRLLATCSTDELNPRFNIFWEDF